MPDLVLQTLIKRGYDTPENARRFLNFRSYSPSSANDLPDMEKGVDRIVSALNNQEVIGVWGDFDVDGQTATAILVDTLRKLGANVHYHLPVRARESHGIKLDALKDFIGKGVQVILTCDTGVSELASIAYAQSIGIDVVVTDHHLLPDVLPPAFALINPRRLRAAHPLSTLPGAGVALKFAEALLTRYKETDNSISLHDLAAIGSIADLAELTGDTRFIVQSGLDQLNSTPRKAIAEMLTASGVSSGRITEEIVSFNLAPRLNAMGRLDDANPMVEFLLSTDRGLISQEINRLEGINERRKVLCDQVIQGALAQIENDPALLNHPALILKHPEWPAGVVGIVASRLVELFHRPVFLLVSPPGQPMRGSARSIEGVDITSILSQNQEHLLTFGGHPMAAGLSVPENGFTAFSHAIYSTIHEKTDNLQLEKELVIDHFLQPDQLPLETVLEFENLAPFGPGNPSLIFAAEQMHVVSATPVGKQKEHLQMTLEDRKGNSTSFIWWHGAGLPSPEGEFDLAYNVRSADYRGQPQVQFEWIAYRQKKADLIVKTKKPGIINLDYRLTPDVAKALKDVLQNPGVEIWKEGTDESTISGSHRLAIEAAETLVIWTAPPDLETLRDLVKKSQPRKIYWVMRHPVEHDPARFLRSLGQSVKKELKNGNSEFSLQVLAACTGMTRRSVELGLWWHESYGNFRIKKNSEDTLTISAGSVKDIESLRLAEGKLFQELAEIQAFVNHLKLVDLDEFIKDLG